MTMHCVKDSTVHGFVSKEAINKKENNFRFKYDR